MSSPEIFVNMWMQEPLYVRVSERETPPVAMHLDLTEAQALMDRLWMAGLRPTEGSGSAGALLATQSHLMDMRTVAFAALGLEE